MNSDEKMAIEITRKWQRDQRDRQEQAQLAEPPQPQQAPAARPGPSMASARRGRPTGARTGDTVEATPPAAEAAQPPAAPDADSTEIEIRGNFARLIEEWQLQGEQARSFMSAGDYWLQRQRRAPEQDNPSPDRFAIWLTCLSDKNEPIYSFELDESYCIPAGTKIAKVTPPIYSWSLSCETQCRSVTEDRSIRIDGNIADLPTLPPCTEADKEMAYQELTRREFHQDDKPELPPEPIYARIPRTAGDPASYLGFTVGLTGEEVTLSNFWCWHAFNLSHPVVISAVSADICTDYDTSRVPIRIYDSSGNLRLKTELQRTAFGQMAARFDQVRLEAGDHLIVWGSTAPLSAQGSTKTPNCGQFSGELPERPLLDALLDEPPAKDFFGKVIEVGMPQWRFKA